MLFKVAAVPFHFWAPDVYEGSPALTTALMSTLAKVVAIATLYKLLSVMNADVSESFKMVVVIISMASMSVGNIMALRQTNVKRMLAFSVFHAGFMLMTLLSLSTSAGSLLYYTAAYSLSGIAAFSVILYVCENRDNEDVVNFHGLGKTNPLLAAILTAAFTLWWYSNFAGFFAKLVCSVKRFKQVIWL
jgi:NADH-quinone oxidoreductase subunit N